MLPTSATPSSTGICGSCPVCQSATCSGSLLRQAGQRVAVQTSVVVRDEQVRRCPAMQLVGDLAPVHLADLTVQISAAAAPGGRSGTGGFFSAVYISAPSGFYLLRRQPALRQPRMAGFAPFPVLNLYLKSAIN